MEGKLRFYPYPQDLAVTTFLPILEPYLPFSNPLFNRLQAPHNIPSRHCLWVPVFPAISFNCYFEDGTLKWLLESTWTAPTYQTNNRFAATFSPPTPDVPVPEVYTILFADRSRHSESQIWVFNPLVKTSVLLPEDQEILGNHVIEMLKFLKGCEIPEWVQSLIASLLCSLTWITGHQAVVGEMPNMVETSDLEHGPGNTCEVSQFVS